MSRFRGIAGCPDCLVPWTVEDRETYLSVKCPDCGRKLGEVATVHSTFIEIIGQTPPMGVPAHRSAIVQKEVRPQ